MAKIDAHLAAMSGQLGFVKWDIRIGNHFPKAQYERICSALGGIVRSVNLLKLASTVFVDSVATEANLAASTWLENFRLVFEGAERTSHHTTMLLLVFANSMNTETPLPPFLRVPDPLLLSQYFDQIDKDVLSLRFVSEPGLATFAAMQVEVQCIHRRLEELLEAVKELVGELSIGDVV